MTTPADNAIPPRARRDLSAPCGDHHGRQWPLGNQTRPAARRGPPPRRRSGARLRARRGRTRHRPSDTLHLLLGKLAPSVSGNQRSDGTAQAVHQARPRRAAPAKRPDPCDWHERQGRWRGRQADPRSGRADAANNTGLVLTTAFNYGSRDEIVRAARRLRRKCGDGESFPDAISRRRCSRPIWTRRDCPTRIC